MASKELEPRSEKLPSIDVSYQNLLLDILKNGERSTDRTGTGTLKVFGRELKADLAQGFPLLTTKKIFTRGIFEELLWFIRGERNIRNLVLKDVHIWDEWPYQRYLESFGLTKTYPKFSEKWTEGLTNFIRKIKDDKGFASVWGDLGPVYGYMWRHWRGLNDKDEIVEIDQLKNAIEQIKNNPDSRRIIVSAWDPAKIRDAVLPPCHKDYQFQVSNGKLNCAMDQRSVDTFIGLPFNIASYASLTHVVADITGLQPGILTLHLKDTHIYLNHLSQVGEQLKREPKKLPRLEIAPRIIDIDDISVDQFRVKEYDPHPPIKAPISV